MQSLWDLAENSPPMTPSALGVDLYDRFESEPDTLVVAIVDEDHRPVGLVERNAFTMKMASPYGRSLYARRPISHLMDADPIVVEADADVALFTRDALSGRASDLLKGFLVTNAGRYVGVGSALGLLNHANAENLRLLRQAERALKERAEFLSVMSHEIRTPLNGVLSVAEILQRELIQDDLRPHVSAILASGGTLLRLLNDSLDFFRGEAGNLDLHEDAFEVSGLLDEAGALWAARAAQAGLTLSLDYDGPDHLWALGDVIRIKQVFNNLIGNALKFATAGRVHVSLKAEQEDLYVTLSGRVSDEGPGIAAEKLAIIFDPFAQTESGRMQGGAGLGLSVCKQLLEKMNGTIRAESVVGEGAAFLFDMVLFYLPPPVAEPMEGAETAPVGGWRVLIADDNPTNRFVAEKLCAIVGCETVSVADGADAVAAALTQPFDLILMDIRMPGMGGVEATRLIRADPTIAHLPIIALTANADPVDAIAYMNQGLDAVVEKPIKPERLFEAMERVIQQRRDYMEAAAA
jgi:signal transduction histidine kinase/ActR/RegA family two-component response regulator